MAYFIALHGKKRCGKNTFLNALKQYVEENLHGCEFVRASFAEALRLVLCEICRVSRTFAFDDASKDKIVKHILWDDLSPFLKEKYKTDEGYRTGPMTWREILQLFGTDVIRDHWGTDAWANIPFEKYRFNDFIVVIDDARFENELRACKREGGMNILITRPALDGQDEDGHASENQAIPADLIDFRIDGVEGVEAFTKQALDFIEKHKKGLFPDVYLNNEC